MSLIACGGDDSSTTTPDAAVNPPDAFQLCGNGIPEGSEGCDDGNEDADDGCSPTCQYECGDGQVTGTEQCDPGIAEGQAGACPTEATCTDEDPCTTAVVSGTGCEVVCDFAVTTAPIDGDACCPAGADATTDSDCTATCGNGIVEGPEEVCDTAIEAGMLGACPTACNDGDFCTIDSVANPGTCAAACTATEITEIGPDDDCCPTGANAGTDPDCLNTCGDGAVTGTETCDTAIPSGTGSCPTACDDGDSCTTDNLVNAGTCLDACTTTPIAPGPADACCPAGADLGDDPDCPPACGDGVVTAPEACDDNNTSSGDGCSSTCSLEPVGFRFTDLDLKDPHLFATIVFCLDVTDTPLGMDGVNPLLQNNIQNDEDNDGLLDLSIVNTFTPLVQTAGTMSTADLVFPDCTEPMSSTSCQLPAGADHTLATAVNMGSGAVCLEPIAGTTSGYTPPISSTVAPGGGSCYVANAGTVTISLSGIPITLNDAHIAGVWFGSPATEIVNGLIRGFISEADADATIIPEGTTGFDSIDGEPLSSLLRGGTGNCSSGSDMDIHQGVDGWYFYLNFEAARVPYTEL